MTKRTHIIMLVAALAAFLVPAAGARPAAGRLTGAGSSFVFPLVSQWQADYESKTGTKVTYSPIGSGGGIAAITARTVDFGASDAPLTPDQLKNCEGCVQIPWALSSTSIAYNLPGVPNNLRITGRILAAIYLGKITSWNDPRIRKLNPKAALPKLKITPVYRSDGSGTTYNFTDYLSTVSAEFKSKVGNSTQVNFRVGIGARGSSGVTGVVSRTEGALTYVDVAYALTNKIKFMAVRNKAGRFALPGLRAIAAASSTVKKVPVGNALSIVDPPATSRLAYPICTFTYVILPLKTGKATDLRRFVLYALTQGQRFGPKLLFVPIPRPVLVAAEKTLKMIHS